MKRWEIYLDIIMELLVILAGALLLIFVLPKAIVFLILMFNKSQYFLIANALEIF